MTSALVTCRICGLSGRLSAGVAPPVDWTCHKCDAVVEVEQVARMSASELVDALVMSAIENHEGPSWHSFTARKLQAIRDELDARLPPRKTRGEEKG